MDFELTDEQRKWRDEVRAFLTKNVTAELLHELTHLGAEARGPELREFRRRVGENGWYGLTWPEEFGGLGRGPIDQHILVTEFLYAGVPGPDFTVTSMVPMILQWGTEQNKREFLPGIASGEIFAAIGYSEPGAGTDLASLRTRAELVGDEWVINGSKIWNSFAHSATHEWLLVRTDHDVAKHKGLSVIMVPIDTPGVDVRPLTLTSLEDAGFCEKGKGMEFVSSHDLTYRGDFPCNTHGGQLSFGQAGIAGGMSHVCDATRQIQNRAGSNQVPEANRAFVSGNGGVMGEQVALILEGE